MRDLFALTWALFSLLFWPPKRIPLNKKCMETAFTEVMLTNKVHGYRLLKRSYCYKTVTVLYILNYDYIVVAGNGTW